MVRVGLYGYKKSAGEPKTRVLFVWNEGCRKPVNPTWVRLVDTRDTRRVVMDRKFLGPEGLIEWLD